MKKYDYKFIKVDRETEKGKTFSTCQEIILEEAKKGWRLIQIVTEFNEKLGISNASGYQIILEREKMIIKNSKKI